RAPDSRGDAARRDVGPQLLRPVLLQRVPADRGHDADRGPGPVPEPGGDRRVRAAAPRIGAPGGARLPRTGGGPDEYPGRAVRRRGSRGAPAATRGAPPGRVSVG